MVKNRTMARRWQSGRQVAVLSQASRHQFSDKDLGDIPKLLFASLLQYNFSISISISIIILK